MNRQAILAAALAMLAAGAAAAHDGRGPGFGNRGAALDFAAIDADGDGLLSRDELVARGVERLTVFDLDGDGTLARAEIVAAMPERATLFDLYGADPREAVADRILAEYDATEAGGVAIEIVAEGRADRLLSRLDRDDDQAISAEEAAAAAKRGDRRDRRRGDR